MLEDEAILVLALMVQGLPLNSRGHGDEARVVFEETVVLAERLGEAGLMGESAYAPRIPP